MSFLGTEGDGTILSGFTVRNGYGLYVGGISGGRSDRRTHATIRSNRITGNASRYFIGGLAFSDGLIEGNAIIDNSIVDPYDGGGGGVAYCSGAIRANSISNNSCRGLYLCHGTIEDNVITGNSWRGLDDCDGTIRDNTISENLDGGLANCDAIIEGNLIVGNSAASGGGLLSCTGTIRNNTVSENSAEEGGGGFAACEGTIEKNTICGNSAPIGGGLDGCYGTIERNVICGNSAGSGGGLDSCDGMIRNNIIIQNLAGDAWDGGGGLIWCSGTIHNNVVVGNSASRANGGGLSSCTGIANCIIWGNSAPDGAQLWACGTPAFCCIEDWTGGGEGNISEDPLFVDADGPDDNPNTWEDNDYHLAQGSPCIDAGREEDWMWDAIDIDGEPRMDWAVDIGADEFSWLETAAPLSFDVPLTSSLRARGGHVYRVSAPPETNIVVTLEEVPADSILRVYASYGSVPQRLEYEYGSKELGDGRSFVVIPDTVEGNYYVLVYAADVPGISASYTVKARCVDLWLGLVSPPQAGNAGSVTLSVSGAFLDRVSMLTLVGPGGQGLAPVETIPRSSTQLFATFDLHGAEAGKYDLVAEDSGGHSARLEDTFEVMATSIGPRLEARLIVPPQVRPGRKYTLWVEYENTGDADMGIPILHLSNSAGVSMQIGSEGRTSSAGLLLLGVSTDGLAGTLVPGQRHQLPIPFKAPQEGPDDLEFTLLAFQGDDSAVDWSDLGPSLRPAGLGDDVWSQYWQEVTTGMPATWNGVMDTISRVLNGTHARVELTSDFFAVLAFAAELATEPPAPSDSPGTPERRDLSERAGAMSSTFDPKTDVHVYPDRTGGSGCCTYVITHGWNSSAKDGTPSKTISEKIARCFPECNIFRVDWEKGAKSLTWWPSGAAGNIRPTAEEAQRQLEDKLGEGFDWSCVTYIGHSFGNSVNKAIAYRVGGKGRAIMLDPANPLGGSDIDFAGFYEGGSVSVSTANPLDASPCFFGVPFRIADRQLLRPSPEHGGALDCFVRGLDRCDSPWLDLDRKVPEGGLGFYDGTVDCGGNVTATPVDACRPYDPITLGTRVAQGVSTLIRPIDPNQKVALSGIGFQRLVGVKDKLQYVIYFENQATATAPAQEVFIRDYLDPALDLGTLHLTEIAFGEHIIPMSDAFGDFHTRLTIKDYRQGVEKEWWVDVMVQLEHPSRLVRWILRTLDPETGELPEDPLAGFLPPNDPQTGCGEGHVAFAIRPKSETPAGTVIKNAATVVFDVEAQVTTNQVSNTVADLRPEAPTWPNPADGAEGVSVQAYLDWPSSQRADTYDLYLWQEGQQKPHVPTAVALTRSDFPPPSPLEPDTLYHWQVTAKNSAGETLSPEWTFRTESAEFRVAELSELPNGRLRIAFSSVSGRTYAVERCDSMEGASWARHSFFSTWDGTEVRDAVQGTGSLLSIYVQPSGNRGFYRVAAP